ncbi:hypothetical protein [[Mycoplasma] testudinis]|uniref:hypothetical protein n=1 Tax=[Mycoplasma] testudinis TaxID=33924 RepID=UPI000481E720|nr:hypothetical protein [[Mycoplasma] testudinis]
MNDKVKKLLTNYSLGRAPYIGANPNDNWELIYISLYRAFRNENKEGSSRNYHLYIRQNYINSKISDYYKRKRILDDD